MKLALRRRVNVKLVQRKEEVIALIAHINGLELHDTADAVAALKAIESQAVRATCLAVTGRYAGGETRVPFRYWPLRRR